MRIGGRQRTLILDRDEKSSDLYVQTLARGLSILSLFDIEHPEWNLRDITVHTGLSKTTAYRMLRTLELKGFVSYNAEAETYNIGPATIPVSYLALSNIGFSRFVHPVLEKLAADTGETVELAVEGKGGAVVVDHVATSHPFKPNLPLGRVLRNLANSGTKILVAYMPEEERERMLREHNVELTPNTITDPVLLRAEFDKVAKAGLAYDREEQDLGICAVSAPVFGPDGDVKASVTVVAPAERFIPANIKRYTEALKNTAEELSEYISRSASLIV